MNGQRDKPEAPDESSEHIRVPEGDTFDVTLGDLPGAGYRWSLSELPAALTLVSPGPAQQAPPGVGASRPRVFRFRADRIGDATVRFVFRRHWEDPVATPAAREQQIVVHVCARGSSAPETP